MAAARECWVQSAAPGHDGGAVHVAWDPGTATVTASQWRVDAGDEAGDVRLTRCGPPASVTLPPGSEANLVAAATVISDADGEYGCCRLRTGGGGRGTGRSPAAWDVHGSLPGAGRT